MSKQRAWLLIHRLGCRVQFIHVKTRYPEVSQDPGEATRAVWGGWAEQELTSSPFLEGKATPTDALSDLRLTVLPGTCREQRRRELHTHETVRSFLASHSGRETEIKPWRYLGAPRGRAHGGPYNWPLTSRSLPSLAEASWILGISGKCAQPREINTLVWNRIHYFRAQRLALVGGHN